MVSNKASLQTDRNLTEPNRMPLTNFRTPSHLCSRRTEIPPALLSFIHCSTRLSIKN